MKHKAGDTVIVKECKGGHQFKIGSAVTILEVDYILQQYLAEDDDSKDNWYVNDDEIEAVEQVTTLFQKWQESRLEAFNDVLKDIINLSPLKYTLDEYKSVLQARIEELNRQSELYEDGKANQHAI